MAAWSPRNRPESELRGAFLADDAEAGCLLASCPVHLIPVALEVRVRKGSGKLGAFLAAEPGQTAIAGSPGPRLGGAVRWCG